MSNDLSPEKIAEWLNAYREHCEEMGDWSFQDEETLVAIVAQSHRIVKLQSQLPAEMQDCTIVFKQCSFGHGWLTATNWIQRECPTCQLNELAANYQAVVDKLAVVPPSGSRRAFVCRKCEGVYADHPVTECDCAVGEYPGFDEWVLLPKVSPEPPTVKESLTVPERSKVLCSVKDCSEFAIFVGVCAPHAMQLRQLAETSCSHDWETLGLGSFQKCRDCGTERATK